MVKNPSCERMPGSKSRSRHAQFLYCTALVSIIGCGRSELSYAPVSGILTVDGKPVAKAQVVLSCDDTNVRPQPTTRGVTDNAGQFVLRSLTPQKELIKGAVVGHHHVFITTQIIELDGKGSARVVRPELLDDQYTKGEELTLEVPAEGAENVRFDLKAIKRSSSLNQRNLR